MHQSEAFASGISLFAVADGHNGKAAARHTSLILPLELERQLGGGSTPASDAAVRQALARTFLATDEAIGTHFMRSGEQGSTGAESTRLAGRQAGWCSAVEGVRKDEAPCRFHHSCATTRSCPLLTAGCTLTAAVVSGDTLTVANVGDSMAILDTGAEVVELTAGEATTGAAQ